jgi:hypothetical protein
MNRKTFLASMAALAAAPFVTRSEPKNELPKDRPVEVADVEEFVRKEIEFKIRGADLWAILEKQKRIGG